MQNVSETYQRIYMSQNYYVETTVAIGEAGRLITENADVILFGGDAILVATSGADSGYGDNMLISVKRTQRLFADNVPQVGCCTCSEVDIEMLMPIGNIPQMAMVAIYIRLVSRETGEMSEWVRKGIFYIDTRDNTRNRDNLDILRIHAYDAMMKADVMYFPSIDFPATDLEIVYDIAAQMGVRVDERCIPFINKGYNIPFSTEYTMRETLGFIGAMYAGNWIINDMGELQLIPIYDLPEETSLLIDELGYRLMFAGDRIKI